LRAINVRAKFTAESPTAAQAADCDARAFVGIPLGIGRAIASALCDDRLTILLDEGKALASGKLERRDARRVDSRFRQILDGRVSRVTGRLL